MSVNNALNISPVANALIFGNSSANGFLTNSNLVYSLSNLSLTGGAFASAFADSDKLLLLGKTNSAKISHSGGWNFNFFAGSQTADGGAVSTGQYNWYTVNSAGTGFQSVMSLSNSGVLNLSSLTASRIMLTDSSKNLTSASLGFSTQVTDGILYNNGTNLLSNSVLTFDGSTTVTLATAGNSVLACSSSANGLVYTSYAKNSVTWQCGAWGTGTNTGFYIGANGASAFLIDSSTSNVTVGLGSLTISSNNFSLGNPASYGGGSIVMFIINATTVPTTNPTGGGILYVQSGVLKYRGSSGTVTTLANA